MNALPGTMLVDSDAPDRDRAAAVWALSHMVAARYHPRHAEHAALLGRQLAFTAWHGSDRATRRGESSDGVCSLFGLGFSLVERLLADLKRSSTRLEIDRLALATGLDADTLLEIPAVVLLDLAQSHDLLAAVLAAEAYRAKGPLPRGDDPQRCAQTWLSRLLTVRGPQFHKHQAAWIQGFADAARDMLALLA